MAKNRPSRLMGILNVTPDSFYAPSRFPTIDEAIQQGIKLWQDGADSVDIGGESTRPGAVPPSEQEELQRVIPVIKVLKKSISIPLSIDTMKPAVAEAALSAGAAMINDVSGFRDPAMRRLAAASGVDICVMHMQGTPATMQLNPHYPDGIMAELIRWFQQQIELLIKIGVKEQQIILDPGIGFGKTVADNLKIIHNLPILKAIGFPVLLGASRKSFLSSILNKPREELLPATIAMHAAAMLGGADIIRAHDVKEHRDMMNVIERLVVSNV